MKYEINLLPPRALLARMEKIKKRRVEIMFFAFFVSCFIVFISYGAIWWSLLLLQGTVPDEILLRSKDRVTIRDESVSLNKEIALLDTRVASYTLWTSHIPDVVLAAPNGILISRLELVEETESLVVTGTAARGSEVVAYQAALENLPWVDTVVAPLQNFARAPEAKVTFKITHKKQ
ncbi:MAG: hypothetical protein AAB649_02520 [Patescibacteria group bacterium]